MVEMTSDKHPPLEDKKKLEKWCGIIHFIHLQFRNIVLICIW